MSRIRADRYTNRLGTGAPLFANGVNVTGNVGVGTTVPTSKLSVIGDMNVTGNVSVGGTLTYDDVTNIDSVGILTARTGIHIDDSITHIGDTNTKIRFPAADTITAETAGTERLRIDSAGMVGINMTPAADGGSTYMLQMYNAGSQCFLSIGNGTSGNGPNNGLAVGNDANHSYLWNREATTILFGTSNTERLRITSDGKVLINDTNVSSQRADAPLQIETGGNGNALNLRARASDNIYSYINFQNNAGSQTAAHIYLQRDASTNAGTLVFGTAATNANTPSERLRITSDGKVGIGILAPTQLLHIKGTNPVINVHSDTATGYAGVQFNRAVNDTLFGIYAYDGSHASQANNVQLYNYQGNIELYAGNAKRMLVQSGGQFNFTVTGTYASSTGVDYFYNCDTTRDYGLYVQKNSNGNYGIYSYTYGSTGKTQYSIGGQVETSSSYSSGGMLGYSINSNTYGIVGYWSTAAYYTIYGNGVSLCTGGHTTSDARLKDVQSNIGTGILDKVCSLEAKKYTWKENTQQRRSVGDGIQIGLLAQDVQEHFPEIVMEHENPEIAGHNPETLNEQIGKTYSIDYGKLTAVLIEAIKDLKAENNSLAARVAALEGS